MKIEQKRWTKDTGWVFLYEQGLQEKAQLLFLFGNRHMLKNFQLFDEIKAAYPNAHILGCSTAGEIAGTQVHDHSLVATAVYFEKTPVKVVKSKIDQYGSFHVGQQLARSLDKNGLSHVFVLSEGLNVNGTDLARGFVDSLPRQVAVTGGLAGDQNLFEETLVFSDGPPEKDVVVAVGFYGEAIQIGYGSMGGWDSFGPERLVTRSQGNVLYELDDHSALELYKKYLGDHARGLPATGLLFPLSIRTEDNAQSLVRTILSINEEAGSMTFAGDIPEGSYARLMKANLERLVDGASGAADICAKTSAVAGVHLAVLISCVGRKLVLKQRVEEEIEAVQERLGEQAILTGFYSYGEICPGGPTDNVCELHNQTMTITTFYEKI